MAKVIKIRIVKKAILTLALTVASFASFAQLSENAKYFKDNRPEVYEVFKHHAVDKWGDDHTMVVYEINEQFSYMLSVFALKKDMSTFDMNVYIAALKKWTVEGCELDTSKPQNQLHVNWFMVYSEYKEQVEAKQSY